MGLSRLVTLVLSACLLSLPVVALSAAPATADQIGDTRIQAASAPEGVLTYGAAMTIVGRVLYFDGTSYVPVPEPETGNGGKVLLMRRLQGETIYRTLKSTRDIADFDFSRVRVRGNSSYVLTYEGGASDDGAVTYRPSSVEHQARVARQLNDEGVSKDGRIFVKGNVNPGWGRRLVYVERATCAKCRFKPYAKQRTTARGRYRVPLAAPVRTGVRWRYRVHVPKSALFVRSRGSVWEVYLTPGRTARQSRDAGALGS